MMFRPENQTLTKVVAVSIVLFAIAAVFFFLAYVGMESGTAIKSAVATPTWARKVPKPFPYVSVYTRDKNPGRFWTDEILYTVGGLGFVIAGLQNLRAEYERRQFEKIHSQLEQLEKK